MTDPWRYARRVLAALCGVAIGWLAWLIGLYTVEYFMPWTGKKGK